METALKTFGTRAMGERLERMAASPRWTGDGFRNVHPIPAGLRDRSVRGPSIVDFFRRGDHREPDGPLPAIDPRVEWLKPPQSGLRATWLGHSTVLLEIDGHRVLTDPVWGPRASPFTFLGPKRFQPVPVALADLPALDAIVISHDHYDHLDYPTIRALRKSAVPIVTSLGVGAHLEGWGIAAERITELDWWESHPVAGTGLVVTAGPSQHFSGRGLKDRNRTLWSSMTIRGPRHAVFFSGDTGLTTQYAEIRDRLGPFDLVMIEIGAFHPSWGDIHLGPEHALEAYRMLGGGAFLPIHWGTFALAMHRWDEPAETLVRLAGVRGEPLLMPKLGQPVEPARRIEPVPWWRPIADRERGRDVVDVDVAPTDAVPRPID